MRQLTDQDRAALSIMCAEFGELIGQILCPTKKAERFERLAALNEMELSFRGNAPAELLLVLQGVIRGIESR
jgi:hypothetical protein